MSATRRPEVFISATSRDLRSCRQLIKEALLTLNCVPVEQSNFPPDHRTVREMLRTRIAGCDAVLHVAGEVYGYEPQERAPNEPRRSFTQLEYDIARELRKPVYVFVCAADFPYDEHTPEDAEKQELQKAHRTRLSSSETLRYDVHTRDDLSLRVRELQTHVEHLQGELKKAHKWLGGGLMAGLGLVVLLGGGMWWLHIRGNETEAQVGLRMEAQQREIADLRTRLAKQSELTEAVLSQMKGASAPSSQDDRRDPTLAAQAVVAAKRGMDVTELRKQLSAEVTNVRGVLAAAEQQRTSNASEQREVVDLQREALLKLSQTELAAANYEAASKALQSALALTEKAELPEQWAKLQTRAGTVLDAWASVSTGRRIAERRTKAIEAHRAALEIYTSDAFPQDRARTQSDLATALVKQAVSAASVERPRLLAEAVLTYRAALAVLTSEDYPQDWARTQRNLAIALRNQAAAAASTDRASLFAEAAVAYRAALDIYTRDTFPQDWARTQSDLAVALVKQASSASAADRVRLLAEAVRICRSALEILTREDYPEDWARTQSNLAVGLSLQAAALTGEQRARLLDDAVESFHRALGVFDRETQPQDWARTQSDLAVTLRRQASAAAPADRARLLADVVSAYRSALSVYNRDSLPQDWGRTQNNLAVALMSWAAVSPVAERARLLADAVTASTASLEVVGRQSNAEMWGVQQWTLGDALRAQADESPPSNRARLLKRSIAAYQLALEVFTASAFPNQHADAAKELAIAEEKLGATRVAGN
ncbi:MAG: DUF4062 domain-containing protein [Opitutus sp.]